MSGSAVMCLSTIGSGFCLVLICAWLAMPSCPFWILPFVPYLLLVLDPTFPPFSPCHPHPLPFSMLPPPVIIVMVSSVAGSSIYHVGQDGVGDGGWGRQGGGGVQDLPGMRLCSLPQPVSPLPPSVLRLSILVRVEVFALPVYELFLMKHISTFPPDGEERRGE